LYLSGVTYSGSATGQRYTAVTGGVIDTATGSITTIPGNSPGSTNCAVTAGALGTGSIGACGIYN